MNKKFGRFKTLIATLCAFFFLLGFTTESISPQLKKFLIITIEEKSREHLPISFLANSISVGLLPLSVKLEGIKTKIDPKQLPELKVFRVDSLKINLDLLAVFSGRLSLANIELDGVFAHIKVDPAAEISQPKAPSTTPAQTESEPPPIFEYADKIPIGSISLNNSHVRVQTPQASASLDDLSLTLKNQFDRLQLVMASRQINALFGKKILTGLSLNARASIDPKELEVETLTLKRGKNGIDVAGKVDHKGFSFENPTADIRSKAWIDLDRVTGVISTLSETDLELSGMIETDTHIVVENRRPKKLESRVSAQDIRINEFHIGHVDIGAALKGDKVEFSQFKMVNPGAHFESERFSVGIEDKALDLKLKVVKSDLPVFLNAIDVKKVPLDLLVDGVLDCKGVFTKDLNVGCDTDLNLKDFFVHTQGDDDLHIVHFDKGRMSGKISADLVSFKFDAKLETLDSEVFTQGEVKYEEGFDIAYQTESLDLTQLGNIVSIKMGGKAKIIGSTQGDSEDAVFSMTIDSKNLQLSDYFLGDAKTTMAFSNRTLRFPDVQSVLDNTRYAGYVTVDLDKNRIKSEISIPFFDVVSVIKAVKNHVPVPFDFTGSGTGELSFEGPLQFNLLSYKLKTNTFRGTFAGEGYDRIVFNLDSKDGNVQIEKGVLFKNESQVTMTGTLTPEFIIDARVKTDNLLLEESEAVALLTNSITGSVNFVSEFTGSIYAPTIDFKGQVKNVLFADEKVPDSAFGFRYGDETFSGTAHLMGNRVKGKFTFPLTESAPFRLVGEANDWNFAAALAVLGGERFLDEYKTNLTGKINLVATLGGFWNSTGQAEVSDFLLQRGTQKLVTEEPLMMNFSQGNINIKSFELKGDDNLLRIEGQNVSQNNLAVNINGRADLRIAHIFLPFLEEVGGPVSFAFKLGGKASNPQILGSAFIENGYTKIFGLPHPFEKVQSDITFSQSRILINSVTSSFAKGEVSGNGHVEIKGYKDIPVDVSGKVEGVELNLPEGVTTKGTAKLRFTGNWFPYLLSGDYRISDGNVTMEFESPAAAANIRQSSLLPEVLIERDFEPIKLDVSTSMSNPIRTVNSYIDGTIVGDVRITNTPLNPILIGELEAGKESVLRFRDTDFDINEAKAQFMDGDQINPNIFISAETVKDPYKIDLLIQGTAVAPIIEFSSQPSLPENDIISLLALGITTDQDTTQNDQQAVGQIVGTVANQNPFSRELKDQLGVDVKFSTAFDENSATVHKITVSRDFSNKLSASASRAIGQQSTTDAEIKYKFTDKLFGIARWEGADEQTADAENEDTKEENILGLDLEYKVEFQ